ncbi:sterol desaturase family protein [Raineya orbicola]|jgi:beta-carotene 3-hydroxylase|uniref:Fatty acid hydroxylase superfamily n=1 Tax=Raineya orbicola TaxID=2016530 RepID=A0A2N3IAQ9_9BACT|nr:sterol desaturase family protein [Raineya orbicola]PKQ67432.1 Fatty acid hydroxylase superfamily [Raineya orbicola]
MELFINIILMVTTFFLMEGVAWATHKYVMHGFLWCWHESHHKPHKGFFEKNDLFAVVFSIPSIATIVAGFEFENVGFLKWIGFGILGYGIFYVLFHDILVHRRVKIKFIAKNPYLRRMIRAHKIHHKHLGKEGAEAFGFLYAPKKYAPKDIHEKVELE